MRGPLVWTSVLLFGVLALSASLSSEHTTVFPRLLESRGANGQRTLIINDDITLQLTPSSVFAEEFVVDTIEDGSPVKYYFQGVEYERNLYHDHLHKASLTVHGDNGIQVEGLIGRTLRIKPALTVGRSSDGHVAHTLYKVQPSVSRMLNGKGAKNANNFKIKNSQPHDDSRAFSSMERQDSNYVAEVYLVLDKYYSRVFNYSKSKIVDYISRFINAANIYLSTLGSYPVSVKVVGLKISKGRTPYLMKMNGNKDKLLADETLAQFRKSFDQTKEYKNSDLFMLITRLDIAEGDENSFDETVTGFSMVGGACTIYKVGFCEDEPYTYEGVYAFVREVSHLLGVVDDGKERYEWIAGNTGAKHCSPAEGYIMGTPNATSGYIHYRHYYYSSCSKYQFETFVRIDNNRACLTTYNFPKPTNKLKKSVFPDKYNMTYICQIMHDDYANVKYLPKGTRLERCRFRCASPRDFRNRSISFDHFVAEGASCEVDGHKGRVCLRGACRDSQME